MSCWPCWPWSPSRHDRIRSGDGRGDSLEYMIGFVWHVWIGVALVGVALLTMVGLLGYFMISVQRKKYPNGKQRRYQDL